MKKMAPQEVSFPVLGMSCANCAHAVEQALRRCPGVLKADVSLAEEAALCLLDPRQACLADLARAVETAGYRLLLPPAPGANPEKDERAAEARRQRRALAVGIICSIPLLALSMAGDAGILGELPRRPAFRWALLLLALPVQFYTAWDFYRGAGRALRHRLGNMDLLIAGGAAAAFCYSLAALLSGSGHLYFETAALIITLVKLGQWLSARTRRQTSAALQALLRLAPEQARELLEGGAQREMAAALVRPGMRLIILPGETVPADGVIEEGQAAIDESLLSGEAQPLDKGPGATLFGGTLNTSGRLVMRATATGEDTALARIIRLTRRAQASRLPVQDQADRLAAAIVPLILTLALAVFAYWALARGDLARGAARAVAVLVVTCPCALGLAAPTAVVAAIGRGARRGLLFKSGEALQRVSRIQVALLDKTGTLTAGRPGLQRTQLFGDLDKTACLRLAASLAQASLHPAARALVHAARERQLPLSQPQEVQAAAGLGSSGRVEERRLRLGRLSWIDSKPPPETLQAAAAADEEGGSAVALEADGRLIALFVLFDQARAGTREAIDGLRQLQIEPVILSGDRQAAVRQLARELGIERFHAELRPEEKEQLIQVELARGQAVAMVGDGINDAPALARATVGVAIGDAAAAASEVADLVLLRPDLQAFNEAILLGRRTLRLVRQNFAWAFLYNLLLVPAAAGLFQQLTALPSWLRELHPAAAAAAMSASSISVVLNSLRLTRGVDKSGALPDNLHKV